MPGKRRLFLLITVTILTLSASVSAERPVIHIKKTQSPPAIDGVLFDDCWKDCEVISDFSMDFPKKPSESQTKAYLCYDSRNLFVAVEAFSSSPDNLKSDVEKFDTREIFNDECVELFIAPEADPKRYFQIVINSKGFFTDLQHEPGYIKPDYSWDCYAETASGKTRKSWTLEIKIPLLYVGLKHGISQSWRFNIIRNILQEVENKGKQKKKQLKKVSMTWAYTGGNSHKPWLFGMVTGPDGKPDFPNHWGLDNRRRICTGMAAVAKSCDCYYKACNNYKGFLPENCKFSGELRDCRNVAVAQYPSKADGYLRMYRKSGFTEYRSMARQLIGKLIHFMKETKDRDGNPWIPWGNVMYNDGKIYGYSRGPGFGRLKGYVYNWNQSKVKFQVSGQHYVDAFGTGFWGISKTPDSLNPEMKSKILKVLGCILDFYHRDYVLKDDGRNYYWRTDDFKPLKPKMPIPGPRWRKLGTDVVYLIMAYDNLGGEYSEKYIESLKRFARFYMNSRLKLNKRVQGEDAETKRRALWRLNYLDGRMLDAAYHLKEEHEDDFLLDWIHENLKTLPRYNKMPTVEFMLDGEMRWGESSIPLLKMFAELNPELYNRFLEEICTYNLFPKGVCTSGYVAEPINESAFPPLLDFGYEGWKKGVLRGEDFNKVAKQVYLILSHPDLLRDTDDWVRDGSEKDRLDPDWRATPMHCYVQNELGEGFYKNGITQAYTINWGYFTPDDRKNVKEYMDLRKKEAKNRYYQYTAPFQNHAEPFQYGRSHTFNLIDTTGHQQKFRTLALEDNLSLNVKIKIPELPEGMPCYGLFDITDILFKNKSQYTPTGYFISKVTHEGSPLVFDVYNVLEAEKPGSKTDKARLVVILDASGERAESELTFTLKKKNNAYFRK